MIREARIDDLDSLLQLEQLSFAHDRFHRRQLRYVLTKAQGKVLVYAKKRSILAALILSWRRNSSVVRITSIAVRPEYHRQGIGTVLISHAETIARARGLKKMHLEVRMDNEKAIRFYEGCGYSRVALQPDYYGDGVAGIKYEKQL